MGNTGKHRTCGKRARREKVGKAFNVTIALVLVVALGLPVDSLQAIAQEANSQRTSATTAESDAATNSSGANTAGSKENEGAGAAGHAVGTDAATIANGEVTGESSGTGASTSGAVSGGASGATSGEQADEAVGEPSGADALGQSGQTSAAEGESSNSSSARADGTVVYSDENELVAHFDSNYPKKERTKKFAQMDDQMLLLDDTAKLAANSYVRTGYTFAGWSTTKDGFDVPDDPDTEADEHQVALPVPDKQELTGSEYRVKTVTITYTVGEGASEALQKAADASGQVKKLVAADSDEAKAVRQALEALEESARRRLLRFPSKP